MAAMIAFKEPRLIHHWHKLHRKAVQVAEWMATEVFPSILFQKFMVVTVVWYAGGSGIHALYRALDISARDFRTGELLPMHERTRAEAVVNNAWDYGRDPYQVCWHHKSEHTEGYPPEWHFHVQVRDETGLREGGPHAGHD